MRAIFRILPLVLTFLFGATNAEAQVAYPNYPTNPNDSIAPAPSGTGGAIQANDYAPIIRMLPNGGGSGQENYLNLIDYGNAIYNAANSYTDSKVTDGVASANSYTNSQVASGVASANSYTNTQVTNGVASANSYTNSQVASLGNQLVAVAYNFDNTIKRQNAFLSQGIAMASAIEILPPNPGDRFAINVGGAGYNGQGAGSVSATVRVADNVLGYVGYARSLNQNLVKGGFSVSIH